MLDVDVNDYAGACRFYVGLADQIKIIDSPEFEVYVDEYLQKCFRKILFPNPAIHNPKELGIRKRKSPF